MKELSQEKKMEIATGASRCVGIIQNTRFKTRLPTPLLDNVQTYSDFYDEDDYCGIRSKLQTKADIKSFKRMAWFGIKHGLLELENSEASIGGTGFKSIVVPDDYRRRVGEFVVPPKPPIIDMRSHRTKLNSQMQLRFT